MMGEARSFRFDSRSILGVCVCVWSENAWRTDFRCFCDDKETGCLDKIDKEILV